MIADGDESHWRSLDWGATVPATVISHGRGDKVMISSSAAVNLPQDAKAPPKLH